MDGAVLAAQQGHLSVHQIVLRITPFLALFALTTSVLSLVIRQAKAGRIALKTGSSAVVSSDAYHAIPSSDEDDTKHDPFDLYDSEIWENGVPLNNDAFWRRVKLFGRLPLLVLSAAVLAVRLAILVLPVVQGQSPSTFPLLSDLIAIAYYAYVLAIALGYLPLVDVPAHWRFTLHIASLLGTVTICKALEALLPADATDPVLGSLVLRILGWVELGCLAAATTVAVLIPRGPELYFPMAKLYTSKIATEALEAEAKHGRTSNVSGESSGCIVSQLLFSFGTKVVNLAYTSDTLDVQDLPVVPNHMRAMPLFAEFRRVLGQTQKSHLRKRGSGWSVLLKVYRANAGQFVAQALLAIITAVLYYGPAAFINRFVAYLEADPDRKEPVWGWIYCFGLFAVSATNYILTGMLWSISTTSLQSRIKVQLNTTLFAKTLVRKDVASSSNSKASADVGDKAPEAEGDEEEDVTSKSQVMTLMTVDVDRVAEFSFHTFSLIDAPIEIVVGAVFCYQLLGVSALVGLLTTCLFLPLNHLASKFVVEAQDRLMQARDERTALMNEVLQGMNMIKYMAWERSFEKRIQAIREKELRWQKRNYLIEVAFSAIWAATPAFVIIAAFTDYVWRRGMPLPPSLAFTAVAVFGELRFALNALPETFISVLQGFVSLRRIEKYLATAEVEAPAQTESGSNKIFLNSATISWPKDRIAGETAATSATSTPKNAFSLLDVTLDFPEGELSLICGRLGSGKTLLLLALLGEADLLTGQLICPRSALDAMATFSANASEDDWIVKSVSAYVPQAAWLRNASIKENILFGLPYRHKRYQEVIEACSLTNDLRILEDGDETEIGESGVNLSGGQKARVSLARAVYSRASVLLLDDVLAAVDAHTAKHIFHKCLKGPLMAGRTVILVSHHVQLCAPGASYVVSLDNGSVSYSGSASEFLKSGVDEELLKDDPQQANGEEEDLVEDVVATEAEEEKATATVPALAEKRAAPRKLIEDEQRATGRISRDVWLMYLKGCGGYAFWLTLVLTLVVSMMSPVLENGWLRHWSESYLEKVPTHSALYYIGIYCGVTMLGVIFGALKYYVMYQGSLKASSSIHQKMLESVLRATVRFHQTESRGRVLARFGKDCETIDSSLPDNILKSISYFLSILVTFFSICAVGGIPFLVAAAALGVLYWRTGSIYGQSSRDMRRLDSVTRSPLYALYGETNGGVAVIRAFGGATNALTSLFKAVDSNISPYYWLWTLNRWLSARFNMLSSAVVGVTAAAVLVGGSSAATAGFALAFANTVPGDLLFIVRRWVATEQSLVGVERVKAYSELPQEAAEIVEPRPDPSWPAAGKLVVQDLEVKYAPSLPTVLHKLNFTVEAGNRCAIVGSTGSGKSTLALALLRLVEAHSGKIFVDDVDISTIGLTDLRTRLSIIPQDPTILSGTLRSTLDPHGEYEDAAINDALRRVHLLPAEGTKTPTPAPSVAGGADDDDDVNANVFKDLNSKVSESGENFSQGEKQLICFARALLKANRLLIMDEATASIDDHSDTLVQQTLRDFAAATITIITIAHRLRTIVDYDQVLVLHEGVCRENAEPWALLQDPTSAFYKLCEATGPTEFAALKEMAEAAHKARM